MKIDAKLTFDTVRCDQANTAHLVVSLTAPHVGTSKRPPLAIVALVDVSGSMSGSKLTYAKKSLNTLVDHFQVGDYFGLVEFSTQVKTVIEPVQITSDLKPGFKSKIDALYTQASTNISDAILSGLGMIQKLDLPASTLNRVILFSDGGANCGCVTEPDQIVALTEKNLGLATISAFGYGTDVSQDFLTKLADTGKGNYACVVNPEDALTAFGKELGGLLSTYATDLEMDIKPLSGHQITKVVSDVVSTTDNLGEVTVRIPNILGEETQHIVFEVKLAEQKGSLPRAVNVFETDVLYHILSAEYQKERKTLETKTKVRFVKAGEEQAKPTESLDQIVGLAQAVRAQIEALEMVKNGNHQAAATFLGDLSNNLMMRGVVGAAHYTSKVQKIAEQGAGALRGSNSSYMYSMSRGITRGMSSSSYAVAASDDLQAMGISLSNSTQAATSGSFSAVSPPATPQALTIVGTLEETQGTSKTHTGRR